MSEVTENVHTSKEQVRKDMLHARFDRGAYLPPYYQEVELDNGKKVSFFVGVPIDTETFKPNESKAAGSSKPHI